MCALPTQLCGYNSLVDTRTEIARGREGPARTLGAVGLHWLHQVLLSLWLGGILILGAVAAPGVFRAAKMAGHTQRGMPLYNFAGEAMGIVFQRFASLVLLVGLLLIGCGIGYGLLSGLCRRRIIARATLALIGWGIDVWMVVGLFPDMNSARSQKNMDAFDVLHHTSSNAFLAQAVLLLGVAALTAWMHQAGNSRLVSATSRTPNAEPARATASAAH